MAADSVEVMYDYDYSTSEGRHITIHKGEVFTLLTKSTNEWWKVINSDQEKFYVPANYVRLVPIVKKTLNSIALSPTKQDTDHISIHTDIPSIAVNGHSRTVSSASAGSDSNIDSHSYDSSLDSNHAPHSPPTPSDGDVTSKMHGLNLHQSTVTQFQETPSPTADEPVAYANMEIIQEIIAQRKESAGLPSSDASDSETWEMHTDDDTGQQYYYNSVTKETTWNSPVIKRPNRLKKTPLSPYNKRQSRISRVTSFRKGWTETVADDGNKTYVHNATGDKWRTAVDASGKEYYYNESSHESLWDLPEMVDDWHPPITTNNREYIVAPSSPRVGHVGLSKEEPTLKLTPPISSSRRASVDVVSARNVPSKAFTLPANLSLASLERAASHEGSDLDGGYTLRNGAQAVHVVDTHKRGYLNKAKLTEGRKKVKKNWTTSYVVAYDNNLLLYKDEKSAASKPGQEFGKPEAIIDLTHAVVDWSSGDKSARKNVLAVTSASGTCYLLQSDDSLLMHQWHTIILGKVKKFNPAVADIPDTLSPHQEPESNNNIDSKNNGLAKRKLHSRRLSRSSLKKKQTNGGGRSVYTLHEDNAEFQAPNSAGPAGEVNKVGIRNKLKKFLTRRPTQESLEKQGIFKPENVFGSRLQFICDREASSVPKFVENCIQAIEVKGLDFDGLYRINGNQAQIQKLRFQVDSTDDYKLLDYDVNVLTGALKLFFRELKEPLIPFDLYHILSETIRDKDQARKARTMKLQLATMSTVHLNTLKYLFAHLIRVLEHSSENRMKSQSIAIVFGPTLMWPEKESSAIAVNMMCQNSIVEYILSGFDRLF